MLALNDTGMTPKTQTHHLKDWKASQGKDQWEGDGPRLSSAAGLLETRHKVGVFCDW